MMRALACVLLATVTGCGGYALNGRVVEGGTSQVLVVRSDDPRLAGPPIADATVRLMLDPRSLGGEPLGTVRTGEDGRFTTSVDAIGAGSLEYEVLIEVRADKRASAHQIMPLPARDRVVLVILASGKDTLPPPPSDPREDVERYMPY